MAGLLEDQIEEAQAALIAADQAGDTEGAQTLANHIRDLQAQKELVDKAALESSESQGSYKNPMVAAGAGAVIGAAANPVLQSIGEIAAPSKINAPHPTEVAPWSAPKFTPGGMRVDPNVPQDVYNWMSGQHAEVPVRGRNMKEAEKLAQEYLDLQNRRAEFEAKNPGRTILDNGLEVSKADYDYVEGMKKKNLDADLLDYRNQQNAAKAAAAKQSKSSPLLKLIPDTTHPTTPFSIVKGGTRGAITGAAIADIPQQIAQGNYGTAAADTGITAGNIIHGLSKTPKGKAIGTLLGIGSGLLRTGQGVNELTNPPEQKADGGLVHLAGGGIANALTQTAINAPYIAPTAVGIAKNVGKGAYAPAMEDIASLGLAMAPLNPVTAALSLMAPGEAGAGSTVDEWNARKAAEEAARQRAQKQFEHEQFMHHKVGANAPKFLENYLIDKTRKMAGGGLLEAGANLAKKVVASKPQKFSEAIEPFIGTHTLHPTIVDKTKLDLAAGRMGGPEAAYLQEISQPHKESGWVFANDSLGAASKLYNMGKEGNTLVTGLLGSPTQLKTNRSVFGELADEYFKAIKEGKMSPELHEKIQARLPTLRHGKENIVTFPTEFDIRDRDAFNEMAKGFHQRGHLADIMGGKGVSQGLPRGAGRIIPYEDILMRNTEESLLGAPTHSIGSRLFTVGSKPPEYRPDLHNAFDYANFGELKSGNFGYVPKEFGYPDEIARIKANLAARGIGRDVTAMDLMRNTINQPITEQLWRRAQEAGFATGGRVGAAKKLLEEAQAAYKAKFTPGFYHGSPSNKITEFDPLKSKKDPDFVTPGITFVTPNPNFAASFLNTKAPNISLTTGQPVAPTSYKSGSTMYPVSVNLGKHFDPLTEAGENEAYKFLRTFKGDKDLFLDRLQNPHSNWQSMEDTSLIKYLRDQGYDTFSVNEGGVKNVGVLNPQNIRGKFAKYNPEEAESPDFMKAAGGLIHLAPGGKVPEAVVKAYKLFRTKPSEPGTLYPLFVNANKPVPIGEWVQAEVGPVAASGKVKSKLGELAYRPGWHAGDLPIATHIGGKSQPGLKAPDYRRPEEVWAEVEMPNDVDWQTIANQRAELNKAGNIIPRTAHITDEVPFGGHYRYKTSQNMDGTWLIGGDMKVNRILTDEEVQAINEAAGKADLPRFTPLPNKAEGGSVFNPQGEDYDYQTAKAHGMGPTGTGDNQGHWGSVAPVSDDEQQLHDLPEDSYVILKGKNHPTFHKAEAAENERGSKIMQYRNRYYSVPNFAVGGLAQMAPVNQAQDVLTPLPGPNTVNNPYQTQFTSPPPADVTNPLPGPNTVNNPYQTGTNYFDIPPTVLTPLPGPNTVNNPYQTSSITPLPDFGKNTNTSQFGNKNLNDFINSMSGIADGGWYYNPENQTFSSSGMTPSGVQFTTKSMADMQQMADQWAARNAQYQQPAPDVVTPLPGPGTVNNPYQAATPMPIMTNTPKVASRLPLQRAIKPAGLSAIVNKPTSKAPKKFTFWR